MRDQLRAAIAHTSHTHTQEGAEVEQWECGDSHSPQGRCPSTPMHAHDVPAIILKEYGMNEIRSPRPTVTGRRDVRKRIDRSITAESGVKIRTCIARHQSIYSMTRSADDISQRNVSLTRLMMLPPLRVSARGSRSFFRDYTYELLISCQQLIPRSYSIAYQKG